MLWRGAFLCCYQYNVCIVLSTLPGGIYHIGLCERGKTVGQSPARTINRERVRVGRVKCLSVKDRKDRNHGSMGRQQHLQQQQQHLWPLSCIRFCFGNRPCGWDKQSTGGCFIPCLNTVYPSYTVAFFFTFLFLLGHPILSP